MSASTKVFRRKSFDESLWTKVFLGKVFRRKSFDESLWTKVFLEPRQRSLSQAQGDLSPVQRWLGWANGLLGRPQGSLRPDKKVMRQGKASGALKPPLGNAPTDDAQW